VLCPLRSLRDALLGGPSVSVIGLGLQIPPDHPVWSDSWTSGRHRAGPPSAFVRL